jgi:ribosome-associated protein
MATPDDREPAQESSSERPSKSQLKRDAQALQDLGTELLNLPAERLEQLELPAELLEAVLQGRKLRHDGSLKRQRKYIGKLIRQFDAEPIRARLEALTQVSAATTRALHQIEAWRDRLLNEGDTAIAALLAEHPAGDRPKIRSLIEAARTERARAQSPRAARLLFKYLRELLTAE